jgi:hypothetical protein
MADQIRSAELLVKNALASPQTLQALRENPQQTLERLKDETVEQLPRALPAPDTRTNNAIWLIVVISFALVMVGSAYILGSGVRLKLDANTIYATKSDTILTVFTTVVAFLAGLLSPSPVKK